MAFSFGKPAAAPTASAPSMFGAPAAAAAAATGLSFGSSISTPAPAANTFGGFGATTAAVAPAPATPAFGGGFGLALTAPQQQQQQQQQVQPTGFQALGATPGMSAAAAANAGSASEKEFEKLFVAYAEHNPATGVPNPGCRMQHVVYNQVDPGLRNSYTRPAHMDEKTWKKAEEDNPDPSKLVPAAVIGWANLQDRLRVQQDEMKKMADFVKLMQETASKGLRSVALVRTRMEASRRRHLAQAHRFLKVQRKLDAIRCLHKPLHDAERQLRMRLEGVHRSLGPPQQTLKDLNSALLQGERQAEEVEEITDPEKLQRIFEHASSRVAKSSHTLLWLRGGDSLTDPGVGGQRDGLEHLMRIVKKDRQDLLIMMEPRM